MSILVEVLGEAGRDNALLVTVDSGQAVQRFLFDCGAGCLEQMPLASIQQLTAVFFSHFHADHIAGFDNLVRCNWSRPEPFKLYGPKETIRVLHHRLQGYTWNLSSDSPSEWILTEVDEQQARSATLRASDGFTRIQAEETFALEHNVLLSTKEAQVSTRALHHGIPSQAYLVREATRSNVDMGALSQLGLQPGPWLNVVKNEQQPDSMALEVGGTTYSLGDLRRQLLIERAGSSVAYLTDFSLRDEVDEDALVEFLDSCDTMVCENNYRDADAELAKKHHHLTTSAVGKLACRVQPQQLILFHLSDRYTYEDWRLQIEEVRQFFPAAIFPDHWRLG